MRGKTEREVIAKQVQALQTKYTRQKHYKQKQTANTDSVNSFMREWGTSYQHAKY